ncbi:TetR/AcrR family transcriptional regulator [Mycobacterium vicinigordonae]|uniref:TetR/AcrR family transcriptional regulator n=1 Tax=Mycobacterium vicinigordonae TaxID=1719132 RepID=A0A7D6I167_9MYCO|nr:TetR/AcrR family transcriptional regulator [Mycobacterium vicinigordonae]QLL07694.1 TetR/AcrR family transcriptional regulator [Mycobacterium vicinigordonae]
MDDVNFARPRGRPPLPFDRILGTALDLVDECGADALSMRSLAQRLGSGTATLYRHFGDRAELIAMVVDRMLGEVTIDARQPWDRACIAFAHSMFDALSRHGNVASLLVGHVPMGANALAHREAVLSLLLENGFSGRTAARTYATLSRYVLGFAMQVRGSASTERDEDELAAAFGRLDPERYPATSAAAGALPVSLADEFDFGLRLLVSGLRRLEPR